MLCESDHVLPAEWVGSRHFHLQNHLACFPHWISYVLKCPPKNDLTLPLWCLPLAVIPCGWNPPFLLPFLCTQLSFRCGRQWALPFSAASDRHVGLRPLDCASLPCRKASDRALSGEAVGDITLSFIFSPEADGIPWNSVATGLMWLFQFKLIKLE